VRSGAFFVKITTYMYRLETQESIRLLLLA